MRTKISRTVTLLMAASLAACAGRAAEVSSIEPAAAPVDANDPFAQMEQNLTPLATPCTFNSVTGLMTVTIAAGETAILSKRAADSAILQNGAECSTPVKSSTVKKIAVTGSTGNDALVLDFTNGLFAMGTSSASASGIVVDLVSGTDTLGIKGTSGKDTFTFGATGILLNTDANKDVLASNVDTYIVSLGDGDDTYSGAGSSVVGGVFPQAITVYGSNGNDTFLQGAAATPNEVLSGGAGTDTVTYASRTGALTVTVGAGADDGEALEADDISADVEVVTGGSGADTMTAFTATAVTFNGGAGNDTLIGDSAADTLNGDDGDDILRGKAGNDVLSGGAGDDTFDEETASNGGDVMNGGAGTDVVDYSARTVALVVTMDGVAANDGEALELDNVKSDVENIKGGTAGDTITGNTLNNVITGGAGNDVLSGGDGDDTFPQGAAGDGDDTISGGTGSDTVDYSARTLAITAVLDGLTASGDLANTEADILGTDVENLTGGSGNDVLTGNASANQLVGGTGDDTLTGLAGDDVLEGGGGTEVNVLDCGADIDIGYGEGSGVGASKTNCEL
jgi:Ca2+-binding RTX toxin-like protein